MTKTILFVCQGNAIRSIIAEAVFNKLCKKDYKAKSAGTIHVSKVKPKTKKVLQEINLPLTKKKPSPLTYSKINSAKKVILMNGNIPNFPKLAPKRLIIKWNILDPVGMPIEEFRKVRNKIILEVKKLIKKLR